MDEFKDKKVVVIGLDAGTNATAQLLMEGGAEVFTLEPKGVKASQIQTFNPDFPAAKRISENNLPTNVDFVVHSSQLSPSLPLLQGLVSQGIPVLSDLELAHRHFSCLSVAITGTNGKTTTAEIVSQMLTSSQRNVLRAGASGLPLCSVTTQSKDLDFLVLDLNCFQLERVDLFRPAVAVVTNIRPDEMDVYGTVANYAR